MSTNKESEKMSDMTKRKIVKGVLSKTWKAGLFNHRRTL
jgi:hypothetical protein